MIKKRFLALFTAFCLFASTWLGAFPVYAIAPPEEQSPANEVYQNGPDTTPSEETVPAESQPAESQPEEPQPAEPEPEASQPEEQPPEEIAPALFAVQPREGEHTNHPVCGAASCPGHEDIETDHEAVVWTPFPTDGTVPTVAGHYYLVGDTTINATWQVPDGTALCLNGHTLCAADGVACVIEIAKDCAAFTLCDCRGEGKVSALEDAIRIGATPTTISDRSAAFNMYGGTLTSTGVAERGTAGVFFSLNSYRQDTFNMYGGTIENMHTGVYLNAQCTFNMYGGKISDSIGDIDKLEDINLPKNAGVILCGSRNEETTFNMYGGQIINGASHGVCVYNSYTVGGPSAFNMYGGEISGNAGAGAIIRSQSASHEDHVMMNLHGGTITGNKSGGIDIAQDDRGIYIYGEKNIRITGNTLRDKNCNVYKKHTGDMINYFPIRFGSGAKNSTAKIEIGFTYQYNLNDSLVPKFPVTIAAPEPSDDFDYLDWFISDEPGKYYFAKDIQRTRMVLVETPHNHEGEEGEYQIFSTGTLPTKPGKYYLVEDDAMNSGGRATWSVPTGGETILCLNGHTLQSNSRDNAAPVISVPDGATLTLCDCSAGETGKIQSNMSKKPNYLVKVEKGGKFNLNSGKIEGTSSQCNVGVYGTFCMTGGKIIGDKDDTTNETGVYVGNDGKFEMTNGNIMDANKGVDTVNGSTIELTGGEISGNKCGVLIAKNTTAKLAGIHIINNTFTRSSTGAVNHGAGVTFSDQSAGTTLIIGDGTQITGNTYTYNPGDGSTVENPCNLFLSEHSGNIGFDGELTSATEIRIYYGDENTGSSTYNSRQLSVSEGCKGEYIRYFLSDIPLGYGIEYKYNVLRLEKGPEKPVITTYPKWPNENNTLTVEAFTGNGEVSYQWRYFKGTNGPVDQGENVPNENGGNTKSCTIPDGLEPGIYTFYCTITNESGGEARCDVRVIIIAAPEVGEGKSPVGKQISIIVDSSPAYYSYTWKYNTKDSYEGGENVPEQEVSSADCTIPELEPGNYWFWCEVKNTYTTETYKTNRVKITIGGEPETPGSKPTINTQPSPPEVPSGESPVGKDITVEATPPAGKTLTYQWYHNTKDSTTGGTPITGGNSAACKIPELPAGTYWFYCVITDSDGGTVTTNTVMVEIPEKNTGDKLNPGDKITTNDGKTEVSRTGDGGTVTIDKDKTDGSNKDTTITLPEDNKKGDVTVNKETGDVTVPGGSTVKDGDGTGGGSGGSSKPDITIGEKGGTVTKDGEVKIPEGGTADVGGQSGGGGATGGTTITGGEGGSTVTPKEDGTVDVSGGGTVKTDPAGGGQDGTKITLPNGGNVDPSDGSVTPDKDEDGKQIAGVDTDRDGKVDTLIVLPGTGGGTTDGDKIKPNGNGNAEVPAGTEIKAGGSAEDKGNGEGGASVTLPAGGEVTPGGGVKPDGNKVLTGEDKDGDGQPDTEVTLPTTDSSLKSDGKGGLEVPSGTTIKNGETGGEITVGGGTGETGGTLNQEGGVDLPKGGTATIEGGEGGKKTEITAGENGGTVKPKEGGGVDVSGGTTVKTGENGAEITVGDNNGEGGTVNKEGEITLPGGGSATIGSGGGSGEKDSQTTITMPEGGGTVKPDESGNVEIPDGSKVKTETTGGAGGGGQDSTEITLPEGGKVTGDGAITPGADENGKQIAGVDTDGDGKIDTLIVLPGTGGSNPDGDKIKPNKDNGGVDVPRGTELTAGGTTGGENSGKVVVGDKGGSVNSTGGLDLPKDGTATIEGGGTGGKTEITAGENGGSVKPNKDGSADVSGSGTKVQVGGSGGSNEKPEITVDDKGGTVNPNGSLDIKDGASVSIHDKDGATTTITAPGGAAGSGQTTVTPKDNGTVDVTPGTTVQTTPGGGSGQDKQGPAITVGDKGGNVSGEGEVKLPAGGTATVDNGQGNAKTEITAGGENGGTVTPGDNGDLTLSEGTTVQAKGDAPGQNDGPKIKVPDGGSVGKDGQVSASKLEITETGGEGAEAPNPNPTIITAPEGGSVTADKDGSAQVPAHSTVSKESADEKKVTTVVTVDQVNRVDANGKPVLDENGNPTVDENGTVKTDKDGTLTFPSGGKVKVQKGDKTATIEIPAGGSICADSTGTSDVSGTVYVGAGDNEPVSGVKITLQKGNTKFMSTTSGDKGGFLLLNVKKGFYNIVAEQGEKTVTRLFNSNGNEETGYKLNLPSDNVSSVLDIDNTDAPETPGSVNVEQVVVGGLNLEAELVKQAENADAVKVTMKVAAKAANKADNAAAIQNVARGKKLEYLEVTVVKEITRGGSSSESNMAQTSTVFEIVIPFNFSSKSNVVVYRHHDGRASALEQIREWLKEPATGDDGKFWADEDTDTVHIYTNRFSTYAIGYDDENGGETPVDPKPEQPAISGGGSGGGSAGSSNVSIAGKVTGGKVTVSPTRPTVGQTVTVNVNPDRGYKLDKLTVTDQNGKLVELTKVSDNLYTFVMPAGKVTVTPTFVKSEGDGKDDKGKTFSDVLENAWYAQYVAYVAAHDLMQGYTDGRFGPNDSTTRGQIVTILYRAEGEPAVDGMSGFADVADTQYYAKAVAWAKAGSIVKGYSSTQFGPEDKITREQLAAILYRYAKYKGYAVEASADLGAYVDYTRISAYARAAMQWAVADGIMQGKNNSMLDPTGSATRAEVAAMLMRFLSK